MSGVPRAAAPLVGIIMGSRSDWETMRHAAEMLVGLDVPHECRVVSAHRTPQRMVEYAQGAVGRGLRVVLVIVYFPCVDIYTGRR